jgi:hypothetical protein
VAKRYRLDVLSSSSDFGGKFRKPLAAKRIFLPVLVESSWKTFRRKFSDGWSAHFMSFHVKRLWKGRQPPLDRHQRVFGFSQFLRICMHREIRQACQFCYERAPSILKYSVKHIVWHAGFLGFKRVNISCKNCFTYVCYEATRRRVFATTGDRQIAPLHVLEILISLEYLISNFLLAVYVTAVIFPKIDDTFAFTWRVKNASRKRRWESKQPKCNVSLELRESDQCLPI